MVKYLHINFENIKRSSSKMGCSSTQHSSNSANSVIPSGILLTQSSIKGPRHLTSLFHQFPVLKKPHFYVHQFSPSLHEERRVTLDFDSSCLEVGFGKNREVRRSKSSKKRRTLRVCPRLHGQNIRPKPGPRFGIVCFQGGWFKLNHFFI